MARQLGTARSGHARRRRHGLSREQIAKAALEFVDSEGLEGLTMQRLAEKLGTGTMTLYGYFRSKHELLDAMLDAAAEPTARFSREGSWRDQLTELVRINYQALLRHPVLVQIRLRQPILRPRGLRFAETVLEILDGAGFEPAEAVRAFRLIFTYMFGFAALSPERTVAEQRREAAAAFALLPPDQYPHLTAAAHEASAAMAGAEQFEYGLQRLLDGIEHALERNRG